MFEKSTFLIIAHAQRADHRDVHRFEKISNIIKQFKLSCIKLAAQFTVSFFFFLKIKYIALSTPNLYFYQPYLAINSCKVYHNSDFKTNLSILKKFVGGIQQLCGPNFIHTRRVDKHGHSTDPILPLFLSM